MLYEYRRVVAFVMLGMCRRGQIGRSSGYVSARLNAVFAGAILTFPAKSSTYPLRPRIRGAKISIDRERTMNDHAVAIVNGILIATIVVQLILVKIWVS